VRSRNEVGSPPEYVAHRIAQMTPDESARDALELVERVRHRLAEYRMTIEHGPKE